MPNTFHYLMRAGAAAAWLAGASPVAAQARLAAATRSTSDTGRAAYTRQDVQFMAGMIAHHAQAVMIAGWAPSHGASASLRAMCERIVVGQTDEIVLIQRWLRDRHETVPQPDTIYRPMPGMTMAMVMPGMLTDAQLAQLDSTRGQSFDRLFLTDMIMHHQGAITMVNTLFGSNGGGEEEIVFRFASDVYADQTTEIARMHRMLDALPGSSR